MKILKVFIVTLLFSSPAIADVLENLGASYRSFDSVSGDTAAGRTQFSPGGFSIRFDSSSIPPLVTTTPPRLEQGCKGMNFHGGSIEFISKDELKRAIKSIGAGTPAYLQQVAFNSICPDCMAAMKDLYDSMESWNQLAADECAAYDFLSENIGDPRVIGKKVAKEASIEMGSERVSLLNAPAKIIDAVASTNSTILGKVKDILGGGETQDALDGLDQCSIFNKAFGYGTEPEKDADGNILSPGDKADCMNVLFSLFGISYVQTDEEGESSEDRYKTPIFNISDIPEIVTKGVRSEEDKIFYSCGKAKVAEFTEDGESKEIAQYKCEKDPENKKDYFSEIRKDLTGDGDESGFKKKITITKNGKEAEVYDVANRFFETLIRRSTFNKNATDSPHFVTFWSMLPDWIRIPKEEARICLRDIAAHQDGAHESFNKNYDEIINNLVSATLIAAISKEIDVFHSNLEQENPSPSDKKFIDRVKLVKQEAADQMEKIRNDIEDLIQEKSIFDQCRPS